MNDLPIQSDVRRLHASLRKRYLSLETDEARTALLNDISAQIGQTTPEDVEVWLNTTVAALDAAARKAGRRRTAQPALTHRQRRGIQK